MKARSRLTLIILTLVTVLCAVALLGCNDTQIKEGSAERIQVEDTHVYLAPEGDPSTYQLKPLVYPVETASQKVYYRLADNTDREFLEVSADGVLKARKLKTDEEGNNVDIIVRVISAENNDVTLNVTVTIEVVEVQKITFNPSTISITMNGGGVDLKPEFYPAHALTGRNVIYSSLNPNVATVNSSGHVTPVSVGVCSIWVQTPKTGAFDEQVEGHVTINVTYAALDYRLDLISKESTLKQIAGRPETISFVLSQLDPFTDANPSITWYINNTTINDVGVKDSKVLDYLPTTLPVGDYYIKAVISNIFETKELVSDTISIYNPLTSISLGFKGDEPADGYKVNDTVGLKISYLKDKYPPESYIWSIVTPSGNVETIEQQPGKDDETPDLYYEFKEEGAYTFVAEAVVKGGQVDGPTSNVKQVVVGKASTGTDITGVYFDGTRDEYGDYSIVWWDALPYVTEYYAEIKTEDGDIKPLNHASGYFGANYVKIPDNIVTVGDSYSIRIKSTRRGAYTDWYEYDGSIPQGAYKYFDEIGGLEGLGFNGYIANMEEYGRLINYVSVFRPEALLVEGSEKERYRLDLYVPFAFEDINTVDSVYDLSDGAGCVEEEVATIDAYKLFATVVGTYVESVAMGIDIVDGATLRGKVSIIIGFGNDNGTSPKSPTKKTEYTAADSDYVYEEANAVTHYALEPRGEGAKLPIDNLTRTMLVRTSNELYLAVAMGYKPVFPEGEDTIAATIYAKARGVLQSIIADNMTQQAKALAIYEWLSLNVVYDYKIADVAGTVGYEDTNAYNSFYLEGVFIDGLAVCDGIAKAYNLLCNMEGIISMKVVGEATGIGHAWNTIFIDGKWYVVDATWGSESTTIGSGDDARKLEMLTKDFFAIGASAKDTRDTYGVYPELARDDLSYAYTITIDENGEYDSVINSDVELRYFISTYLNEQLTESGTIWTEIIIDDEYLLSKGGIEAIYLVINNAAPDGVEVSIYGSSGKKYIEFKRG
ncbi:MAG: hypothetical protein IJ033_02450 [Clostridia bacterium]|nr:hypothetical protein [Clostridia bacterium]